MNILKGLYKAQELKKFQTLNILSQMSPLKSDSNLEGKIKKTIQKEALTRLNARNKEFNIKLNSVHLDKRIKPSIFTRLSNGEKEATPENSIKVRDNIRELKKLSNFSSPRVVNTIRVEGSSINNKLPLRGPLNFDSKNITGSIGVSYDENFVFVEKSTSLQGYIRNNDEIEKIKVSPKIGIKNGLLLNYQKFISYNFNKSSGHCF